MLLIPLRLSVLEEVAQLEVVLVLQLEVVVDMEKY
jgi:hypothetical protein